MNAIQIDFTVSVDVDRKSNRFSELAVEALDPTRRGPRQQNRPPETVDDAEKRISSIVALEAVKDIFRKEIDVAKYGKLTITVTNPKTLTDLMDQEKVVLARYPSKEDDDFGVR